MTVNFCRFEERGTARRNKMQRQQMGTWLALGLLALPVMACGDDDDAHEHGDESVAGKGGSSGGKAAGAGGASAGSKAAAGGSAGGKAGAGGSTGIKEAYAAIEKVADVKHTQANDLRGITYSASGKIWASGHTDVDAANRQLVLARFNADVTPDEAFDGDGFLIKDLGPGDEQSIGLVELANGDVVVQAAVSDNKGGAAIPDTSATPGEDGKRTNGANVVLVRFTSKGELVKSFGTNGVAPVLFGWKDSDDASWPAPTYDSSKEMENQRYSGPGFPTDAAWGVRLDSSGDSEKLVVNGFGPARKVSSGEQRYDNDRYVARLLASTGKPDPDFNGGEAFTLHTQDKLSDGGRRAFVDSDGTIYSAGYTNLGTELGNHVVLLKLKPDGTPDESFGFGEPDLPGVAIFNPFVESGGVAECYGITQQKGGRLITTGYGRATGTDKTSTYGYATSDGPDLVSFAVKADGSGIDTAWGNKGTRAIQSEEHGLDGTEDRGRDLVALSDGRVVQVGRFGVSPAIFVLTPDGELDEAQGEKGIFSYTPFETTPSHFFGVALSKDGKHIAAATSNHADGVILAILKVAD
jgi:uncharacterized delta-60 repeat protein